MTKKFALVTGASKGLGKLFAHELSRRDFNTILLGLPDENLQSFCAELKAKYGTESICYETDLTKKSNLIEFTDWVNSNFEVNVLINNAGIGGSRKFSEVDVDYIDKMIQLNVRATTLMTHQLLPNLMRNSKSYILNVSSLAAFSPIGYKTVYPASKVFINYFSRGLNQELADTGVYVSVINPGPMKTNEDVQSRLGKQGLISKIVTQSPEKVARKGIDRMFKKKSIIVLNNWNLVAQMFLRLSPTRFSLSVLTKAVKREITWGVKK